MEVQKNNYNSLEKEIEYHPGYDFFVFPKSILKSLYFENIIIGYPPIGAIFLFNLLLFSEVIIIHNWLLTWHIGDDKNWKGEINKQSENNQAALKSIRSLLNQKKIKKIILQKIKNGFYGKTLKNLINESIKNID